MKKPIEDLTLLLLYLTSFEDPDIPAPFRVSWKGYSFEALDALAEQDFVRGSKGSKSVYLTEKGQREAKALKRAYLPGQARDNSLQQLLKTKTREELIDCLLLIARDYDGVEEQLQYTLNLKQDDIAQSRALVRRYIKQFSPLSSYNIDFALRGAYIILETIPTQIAKQQFVVAMQLIQIVMEEMLPLFDEALDIDHEVSMCLDDAVRNAQQLCKLSAQLSDESEKAYLFEEMLKLNEWEDLQQWGDWQSKLLHSATYLCDTPERKEQLAYVLDIVKER